MKSLFESFFLSKKSEEILNRRGLKEGGAKSDEGFFDDAVSGREASPAPKPNKVINRRDFLKAGAGIGAVVVAASVLENDLLAKTFEKISTSVSGDNAEDSIMELIDDELKKMAEEDARPIRELINYRVEGPIDLTGINTQEILKSYWKKRYQEDSRLRNSFEKAYYEMGAYDEQLKKIFKKVGVPEEFCYLAIPESHWNMTARSGAGAVGPYQFIAETAERWGLKTGGANDERMDPLKSGWACANELKYLYDKSGDWDLAFSGYNGSKIFNGYLSKDYKKVRDENGKLFTYKGLLKYAEEKINEKRDTIRNMKFKEYEVVSGDTVGKIAEMFNKKKEQIITLNGIVDYKIQKGQTLKIPYSDEEKEADFNTAIAKAGYFENLTYPAKFNAINELIKEGFVVAQRKPGEGVARKVAILEPKQVKIKASKTKKA